MNSKEVGADELFCAIFGGTDDLTEFRRAEKAKLDVKLLCKVLIELVRPTGLAVLIRSGGGRREASESTLLGVVLWEK